MLFDSGSQAEKLVNNLWKIANFFLTLSTSQKTIYPVNVINNSFWTNSVIIHFFFSSASVWKEIMISSIHLLHFIQKYLNFVCAVCDLVVSRGLLNILNWKFKTNLFIREIKYCTDLYRMSVNWEISNWKCMDAFRKTDFYCSSYKGEDFWS